MSETPADVLGNLAIALRGPPDLPERSQMVGLCGVSEDEKDPIYYGWMVKDFFVWKALFYKVGKRAAQSWLSAVDVQQFIRDYIPEGVRATVLEKVLGKGDDVQIYANGAHLVDAFLDKIREKARLAHVNQTALVIIYLGPVTPEGDICISGHFLTLNKIRNIIRQVGKEVDTVDQMDIPTVMVTTSPLTGGWLCYPAFVGSGPKGFGDNKKIIQMMAKNIGSVYGRRIIDTFTTKANPFLEEKIQAALPHDNITPIRPSAEQASAHAFLHQAIHRVLQARLSEFAMPQPVQVTPPVVSSSGNPTQPASNKVVIKNEKGEIVDLKVLASSAFNTQSKSPSVVAAKMHGMLLEEDGWQLNCGPRVGRDVEKYRGNLLDLDGLETRSTTDPLSFLGNMFGGTYLSQVYHLQYLAHLELNTCPGDWAEPGSQTTKDLYTSLVNGGAHIGETIAKSVFDVLEFRGSSFIFAEILAKYLGLTWPTVKKVEGGGVRFWPGEISKDAEFTRLVSTQALFHNFSTSHSKAVGVTLPPFRERDGFTDLRLFRDSYWLAKCIVSKRATKEEDEAWVKARLWPVMDRVRLAQIYTLMKMPLIANASRKYLALSIPHTLTFPTTTIPDTSTVQTTTIPDTSTVHTTTIPDTSNSQTTSAGEKPAKENGDSSAALGTTVTPAMDSPEPELATAVQLTPPQSPRLAVTEEDKRFGILDDGLMMQIMMASKELEAERASRGLA